MFGGMKEVARCGEENVWRCSRPVTFVTREYQENGKWQEELELRVMVLDAWKSLRGNEDEEILDSVLRLAFTYWNLGQWRKAEELEVAVMKARKRVLGNEHPDTLTSMNNLASTYWSLGRLHEA